MARKMNIQAQPKTARWMVALLMGTLAPLVSALPNPDHHGAIAQSYSTQSFETYPADRANSYSIDGQWYSPNSSSSQWNNRWQQRWNNQWGDRSSPTIIRGDIEDSTLVNPIIIDSSIEDSVILQPRNGYDWRDYDSSGYSDGYYNNDSGRPFCGTLAHRRQACQ